MKIDRLIGILSVLLQREKVTAAYLAEKFEVSRRTIVRDIEAINQAGIPVITIQGRDGGIYLAENFTIDRTVLSSAEMKTIISGLQSLDSVSKTGRYRTLMAKLSDGTPGNHIIIDLSGMDKDLISDKIELINSAIENGRKIYFTYYAPSGTSTREIEPYHLIFQWSGWYVWGYCTLREDYRMFKLSRITELKVTDKAETRNVPEYVVDKLSHSEQEIHAKVKFDKSVKWRIVDDFSKRAYEEDADGNIILDYSWSDAPSFYDYILGFGDKAEILSPEEYRKEFAEIVKRVAEKY
ncbi:MAG: YafY family transcriptional regulator [Eubacterium sp.]|nr:YafY family transcriptional regulator [Eubacterium sp.]